MDELKSRDLVDENVTADDYLDIDFQVTTSETSAMTDQEILDSILINDLTEEAEEETEEKSSDVPLKKPKLAEVAHSIDLLERWSLFDKNGGEMRKSLSLISKRFDKHSFESKKQSQIPDFFKTSYKTMFSFVIFCRLALLKACSNCIPNFHFLCYGLALPRFFCPMKN